MIYFYTGSLDFFFIYSFLPFFYNLGFIILKSFNLLDIILFCFIIGSFTKSAQIGFHIWLLDAMEGPTPVSALIHAATMVTAGIFLLLRVSFLLEFTIIIKFFLLIIGSMTAFLAAFIALFQYDIKTIIAYSTCSQLGYMIICIGIGHYYLGFFHLLNHGFFKALLFLLSGKLIHSLFEEQDIRRYGGLAQIFPLTYCFFIIGFFSLSGIPFLSGFYSKDTILAVFNILPSSYYHFFFQILLLSAIFTSLYSIKIVLYTFFITPNNSFTYYFSIKEYYSSLELFLFIYLIFFSIFFCYLFKDFFLGIGYFYFSDCLFNFSYINRFFLFFEFFYLQNLNF